MVMSLRKYHRTRRNKDRVLATNIGKRLIRDFSDSIVERNRIEHPEYNMNNLEVKLTSIIFYFFKYLLEYYVDLKTSKNSGIFLYSELSDDRMFTFNYIPNGKDGEVRLQDKKEFFFMLKDLIKNNKE